MLSTLVVSVVRLTAGADTPVPPLRLDVDWTLLAVALAAYAVAAPLLVGLVTWSAFRSPGRDSTAEAADVSRATAIEARDLFRIYESAGGNAAALQGLTLSVRDGEILVVLGPSGSGKTTLLRILAGLDRPSAGRAIVHGTDLTGLSSRALSRYRSEQTGYADQHYSRALAPELTARELVGLRLGLKGATRAERGRRADELLERVGLAGEARLAAVRALRRRAAARRRLRGARAPAAAALRRRADGRARPRERGHALRRARRARPRRAAARR